MHIDLYKDELNVKHDGKITTLDGRCVLPVLYDQYPDEAEQYLFDDLCLMDNERIDLSGLHTLDGDESETPLALLNNGPTYAHIITR